MDIVGRTISKLGDRLEQPIVVENKAGAGTVGGCSLCVTAPMAAHAADQLRLRLHLHRRPALNAKLARRSKAKSPSAWSPGCTLIRARDVPVNNLRRLIAAGRRTPDDSLTARW